MSDPMPPAVPDPTVEARIAEVLGEHRFSVEERVNENDPTLRDYGSKCSCGQWSALDQGGAHADHLAAALTPLLAASAAAPDAHLCSQCGERDAAMVKIGTTDGWCTVCLDEAAEPAPDALRVRIEALIERCRGNYADDAGGGEPLRNYVLIEELSALLEDGAQ